MKFLFHFIFLLFLSLPTQAQEYAPLLQEGKTWDIYHWDSEFFPSTISGVQCFIQGDSVIGNVTYKHLRMRYILDDGEWPYLPPFHLGTNDYFYALMREDTASQQVFSYFTDTNTGESAEVLVYDFSLQPGDTIYFPQELSLPPDINNCCFWEAHLDSISSVTLQNAKVVRQFHFTFSDDWSYFRNYIESLGNGPLLIPFTLDFEFGATMGCVQLNGDPIWGNCNKIVGVSEPPLALSSIQLIPNPASSREVSIQLRLEKATPIRLQLFSTTGTPISPPEFHDCFPGANQWTLPLPPDLSIGAYFVQIQLADRLVYKKWVLY
ncbi:MAG: T9SS type A sorting domain-containing protein [Lewinellaceae bacterium]|nr:T9SS type A sorting domain-containing protein [Lewinellaceae bacterium]